VFILGALTMTNTPNSGDRGERNDEIARLRDKVGELTIDNELLLQRCRTDRPFVAAGQ
jgi:hypothetical protein